MDNAADAPDAADTAAAPDASETSGEGSRASEIFASADEASASELAEVQEELSEVGQAIWGWFNDHAYNSPISRATEALNHLRLQAVPDLIKRIERI